MQPALTPEQPVTKELPTIENRVKKLEALVELLQAEIHAINKIVNAR